MTIRQATQDDLLDLLEMAEAMHGESDFSTIPFDHLFCRDFLEITLDDPDNGVFIDENEGVIRGAFLGSVEPFFFSSRLKASDTAIYVKPEFRGSATALRLIRKWELWAWEKGAIRTYLGVSTGNAKADDFFTRLGYTRLGGIYRKEKGA